MIETRVLLVLLLAFLHTSSPTTIKPGPNKTTLEPTSTTTVESMSTTTVVPTSTTTLEPTTTTLKPTTTTPNPTTTTPNPTTTTPSPTTTTPKPTTTTPKPTTTTPKPTTTTPNPTTTTPKPTTTTPKPTTTTPKPTTTTPKPTTTTPKPTTTTPKPTTTTPKPMTTTPKPKTTTPKRKTTPPTTRKGSVGHIDIFSPLGDFLRNFMTHDGDDHYHEYNDGHEYYIHDNKHNGHTHKICMSGYCTNNAKDFCYHRRYEYPLLYIQGHCSIQCIWEDLGLVFHVHNETYCHTSDYETGFCHDGSCETEEHMHY